MKKGPAVISAKGKGKGKGINEPFMENNERPLVSLLGSDANIVDALVTVTRPHTDLYARMIANSQENTQEFLVRDVLPILTEPLLTNIRAKITSCIATLFPNGLIRTYFDSPNVIERIMDAFHLFGSYHFEPNTPEDEIENVVRFVCLYVGLTILRPDQNITELGLNELIGRNDDVKTNIEIENLMGGPSVITLIRNDDGDGARDLCQSYNDLTETYALDKEQLMALLIVDESINPNAPAGGAGPIAPSKYVFLLPDRDRFIKASELQGGDAGIFAHYTGGAAYLGCLSSAVAIFWSLKQKRNNTRNHVISRKENWDDFHHMSKGFEALIATTRQNLKDHNLDTMSTLFVQDELVGPIEIEINGKCLTNFCIKLLINSENGITIEESKELLGLYVSRVMFHSAKELTKEHVFNDRYTQESQNEVDVAIKKKNKARMELKSMDRLSLHDELLKMRALNNDDEFGALNFHVKEVIQNWEKLLLTHRCFKNVFDDIPELVEVSKKRARAPPPPFTVVTYSGPIHACLVQITHALNVEDYPTFESEKRKLIILLMPSIKEIIKEAQRLGTKNKVSILKKLLTSITQSSSFPNNEARFLRVLLTDIITAFLTVVPNGANASAVSISNNLGSSVSMSKEVPRHNVFPVFLSKDNLRQTAYITKQFLELKLLDTKKKLDEYKHLKKSYNEANKAKLSPNITQKYRSADEYIGKLEQQLEKFNNEIGELGQLNSLNITNNALTENGIARLNQLNLEYNLSNYSIGEDGHIYSENNARIEKNTTEMVRSAHPTYTAALGYQFEGQKKSYPSVEHYTKHKAIVSQQASASRKRDGTANASKASNNKTAKAAKVYNKGTAKNKLKRD
jgi:hypothetical protein